MIAEQKVKELENCAVEVTITVAQETVAQAYRNVVQKYTKTLQVPGFRKGKTPESVLEHKIGPAMREECIYTLIDDTVRQVIENIDEQYKPLPQSMPVLVDEKNIPKDVDKELQFAISYDIFPIFELPPYTGLSVEIPQVDITDETVAQEIEKLREQSALVLEKDAPAQQGDIVTITYVELNDEGDEIENTRREDFVYTVGRAAQSLIDDEVVGMEKDTEKIITKSYPEEYAQADYAGRTVTFKVTMKQVKVREVPVLDDEFAQDVSEQYKTVDDLVAATKEKLEKNLRERLKEITYQAIMDTIVEKAAFPLPRSMVEAELNTSWYQFVSQSGISEEQVLQFLATEGKSKEDVTSEWRERTEKAIRTQLLLEKIIETENFSIDYDELEKIQEEQLQGVNDPQTRSYYRTLIENTMKRKKAVDFLIEHNTITSKEKVSYEDFMATHSH